VNLKKLLFVFALCFTSTFLSIGSEADAAHESESTALPILQGWQGDYPVSQLGRLPEGRRSFRVGFLDDLVQFTEVWQAFKPDEKVPELDFSRYIVVFSRNVTFYNRVTILKVLIREGVAEILVMETMSALPIEDKIAMAMAVVPRKGVNFIEAGNKRIPVKAYDHRPVCDPLNTAYTIEGRKVRLQNGYSESVIAPGSAIKVRTLVVGKAACGDLDGDGDKDAVVFLAHDSGGSGTFYYVGAALNLNGSYHGTNAVGLGDRIIPRDIAIRDGVISANYTDRKPHEPMSTEPSVDRYIYMTVENGKLAPLKDLEESELVLSGWVIIGHEVRSFKPCSQEAVYWLSGSSPAIEEIMAKYRETLPDARPYTSLFMILAGKFVERPRDGFGADYTGAFLATQLVGVRLGGNCLSDSIVKD
jgi:hypothetical protein